ncbi:transposase insK for insertion sequence element IS150 [Streptococcus dysgalactiae]|nr:transposase insK for insertion sequence element IS150 [Streptococcus dysgalactiae]
MCRWLNIPRSSYYYQAVDPVPEADLEDKITYIFFESKSRYGARKIKKCLEKDGIILSRRRIRRIMERLHLVSVYQKAAFKPHSKGKNEAPIPNRLDRQFKQERPLQALVTDLTYVRVGIVGLMFASSLTYTTVKSSAYLLVGTRPLNSLSKPFKAFLTP